MGVKKKKKIWSVSEKMEIIQARQNGLLLDELTSLYGVSGSAISDWVRKYEAGGIAGLEPAPSGGVVRKSAKVEAAEPPRRRSSSTEAWAARHTPSVG